MWKENFTALKETADKLQTMRLSDLKSGATSEISSTLHEGGSQDGDSAQGADIHNLKDPSEEAPTSFDIDKPIVAKDLSEPKLSAEQLTELRAAFDALDTNKDGVVTKEELSDLLKGLGDDVTDETIN